MGSDYRTPTVQSLREVYGDCAGSVVPLVESYGRGPLNSCVHLLQPISHNFPSFLFPDCMHVAQNKSFGPHLDTSMRAVRDLGGNFDIQSSTKQTTRICRQRLGRSFVPRRVCSKGSDLAHIRGPSIFSRKCRNCSRGPKSDPWKSGGISRTFF